MDCFILHNTRGTFFCFKWQYADDFSARYYEKSEHQLFCHYVDSYGLYALSDHTCAIHRPSSRYVWPEKAICFWLCAFYADLAILRDVKNW